MEAALIEIRVYTQYQGWTNFQNDSGRPGPEADIFS